MLYCAACCMLCCIVLCVVCSLDKSKHPQGHAEALCCQSHVECGSVVIRGKDNAGALGVCGGVLGLSHIEGTGWKGLLCGKGGQGQVSDSTYIRKGDSPTAGWES